MPEAWFLYHTSEDPFAYPVGMGKLKLRLFTQAGQHLICTVIHSDRYDSPGHEIPVQMERMLLVNTSGTEREGRRRIGNVQVLFNMRIFIVPRL